MHVLGIMLESKSSLQPFGELSVSEARTVHNKIMEYMFKSKHRMVPEEASIMGEFISSGIAIGFAVGVTVALIARRHPLTKKHPNLIGIAAAGTADALSRDYRRPMVYEKLLKLDTPLASKGKEILFGLRSGTSFNETASVDNFRNSTMGDHGVVTVESHRQQESVENTNNWWGEVESEQQPPTTDQKLSSSHGQIVTVNPLFGTRTWRDIRNEGKKD